MSTSYIQSDPFTGQILHAHIFVLPETMMDGDLTQQNDQLRYIVGARNRPCARPAAQFRAGPCNDRDGLFQVAAVFCGLAAA